MESIGKKEESVNNNPPAGRKAILRSKVTIIDVDGTKHVMEDKEITEEELHIRSGYSLDDVFGIVNRENK